MKLIRRHPDRGYFDTWLWLPRKFVSERQIQTALLYEGRNQEIIEGWREEPHHLRVPRNFYSPQTLSKLPYPVYDTRFKDFPRVKFQSSAKMDLKEPTKTYQREGCKALLGAHDGILCLRCGAGKTVVALHAAAQLGHPILVVVNEKSLARQWMQEINKFLHIPMDDIGQVGGDGASFDWRHPITVALVQTLATRAIDHRLPPEMTHYFGVIISDEAHVMAAPHFNQAIPPFHGKRWGLSATPTREDGFDSLLRSTMGEIVYTYLTPDLHPKVYFRQLPTRLDLSDPFVRDATHDVTKDFHFGKTYGYFAEHVPERTNVIVADIQEAISKGRQCLVLTHSRAMCDQLGANFPDGGVCYAGVKGAERVRRIENCNPVIAIMQIGKQALNKPSLDTLFISEPFRKEGVLQQTMGRVLRNFAGKKDPMVIFYEDVYITPLRKMCDAIRRSFSRWPKHKGGRVPFYNRK
jgi:superfamily II DNA or RNA helicase